MSETAEEQRAVMFRERNRLELLDVLNSVSEFFDRPRADATDARLRVEAERLYDIVDTGAVPHHDLLLLLNEAAEVLEGEQDVNDGSYGQPEPNRAMSLLYGVEESIGNLERGRV